MGWQLPHTLKGYDMPPQNAPQGGAQVRSGGLMAKYGAKLDNAVKAHAGDETDYGMMRLPGGITNGIAQLKVCTFGVYKTGKNTGHYFLRMAGVVMSPYSVLVDGVEMVVAGQQTQYMEALCDTVNSKNETITTDEHVANILNEFRKLGADTSGMGGNDLEGIAAMLAEAKPYFRFSTTMLPPMNATQQPRVFENWNGTKGLENYDPTIDPASQAMVNDGGSEPDPMAAAAAPAPQEDQAPPANDPPVATEAAAADDGGELAGLITKADKGDKAAMLELKKRAMALGVAEEDVDAANNWAEVGEAITALQADGEANAPPAEDAPWKPAVDETYDFEYKNSMKKLVKGNHKVVTVDEAKQTVDLLNLRDGKTIQKAVPWDKLESAS